MFINGGELAETICRNRRSRIFASEQLFKCFCGAAWRPLLPGVTTNNNTNHCSYYVCARVCVNHLISFTLSLYAVAQFTAIMSLMAPSCFLFTLFCSSTSLWFLGTCLLAFFFRNIVRHTLAPFPVAIFFTCQLKPVLHVLSHPHRTKQTTNSCQFYVSVLKASLKTDHVDVLVVLFILVFLFFWATAHQSALTLTLELLLCSAVGW